MRVYPLRTPTRYNSQNQK